MLGELMERESVFGVDQGRAVMAVDVVWEWGVV